jgi:hypothetical protein
MPRKKLNGLGRRTARVPPDGQVAVAGDFAQVIRRKDVEGVRDSCNSSFRIGMHKGFAAQHHPRHDQFPELESVQLRVGTGEEFLQPRNRGRRRERGRGRVNETERNRRHRFRQRRDARINPRGLLVGAREQRRRGRVLPPAQPRRRNRLRNAGLQTGKLVGRLHKRVDACPN